MWTVCVAGCLTSIRDCGGFEGKEVNKEGGERKHG